MNKSNMFLQLMLILKFVQLQQDAVHFYLINDFKDLTFNNQLMLSLRCESPKIDAVRFDLKDNFENLVHSKSRLSKLIKCH